MSKHEQRKKKAPFQVRAREVALRFAIEVASDPSESPDDVSAARAAVAQPDASTVASTVASGLTFGELTQLRDICRRAAQRQEARARGEATPRTIADLERDRDEHSAYLASRR